MTPITPVTLFKGETIRNKTSDRTLGRYITRVIAHNVHIWAEAGLLHASLPNGGSASSEAQDGLHLMNRAVDGLLYRGWRRTADEATADAELEASDRRAGRVKFG